MDISEKIASLSEDEAKFALSNLVHYAGGMASCKYCVFAHHCKERIGALECKRKFLKWALGGVYDGEE